MPSVLEMEGKGAQTLNAGALLLLQGKKGTR